MQITMFSNLSKSQAFSMAFRVSVEPQFSSPSHISSKLQFLGPGFCVKPSKNRSSSSGSLHKPIHSLSHSHRNLSYVSIFGRDREIFCGYCVKFALQNTQLRRVRRFSSSYAKDVSKDGEFVRDGKSLPWLADTKFEGKKRSEKGSNPKPSRSSWEVSAEKFLQRNSASSLRNERSMNRTLDSPENRQRIGEEWNENVEVETGEDEEIDDPRWDKIKNKLVGSDPLKKGSGKRVWSKQENWVRKTWREATESSIPKMVGEGVYGVGPVLAALSARRREFYALYVQEGLDLSKTNKKKKDKKGFEKVLTIADKIGLTAKQVSKHDLNMIVDNRPHQGLILDASPLEIASIKQLDPVSDQHDTDLLWIALDEVTDPQNLGAIIRCSYFFGASGVVLCAKNSAPLSGVVSKASAGSLELMEVRTCKNMMQFLASSAQNGWRVLGGSVSSRAIPLHEVPPNAPTVLVLGSEGAGLRPLVERACTELVRIPGNIALDVSVGEFEGEKGEEREEFKSFMAVESLNVSVAAGVLLHHLIGRK